MSDDVIISVKNLSKSFKLYQSPKHRLLEALHPFRKQYHHEYHALKDISFEIKRGESVGIIGKNGAGKSTLLKILTGVMTPTSGTVEVKGKIAALLELGSGFNPNLSGMENIFFQGAIMGFSEEEMKSKVQEIVDFADIGEYIHQPVKTYSSGMFARLAFSIAISVEPDILIVDEALSVGDIFFQIKCFEKFKELKSFGVTVLFVTHGLESVISFCSRGMVFESGALLEDTTPKGAVNYFKKLSGTKDAPLSRQNLLIENESCWKDKYPINTSCMDYGSKEVEIVDFGLFDGDQSLNLGHLIQEEKICLRFLVKAHNKTQNLIFAYAVKNAQGLELFGGNSYLDNNVQYSMDAGEKKIIEIDFKVSLNPGEYLLSLGVVELKSGEIDVKHRLYDILAFNVSSTRSGTGLFKSHEPIKVRELHV
jgi:ABC-type polysaccharide/polyol phosphate transport system ATPase subunit